MEENEKKYETESTFESEAQVTPESESVNIEEQNTLPTLNTDEASDEIAEPINDSPAYRWNYSDAPEVVSERKKKRSALIYAAIMTCAFLVSFAILLVLLLLGNARRDGTSNHIGGLQNFFGGDRIVYVREYDEESGVLTTQEIYDKCLPSVVSVSITSTDGGSGIGSGFIISEDGYIITANHVIDGTKSINVILSNNKVYPAQVIGGNEFTDVALIKIDATDLTPMKIGSSSNLLVGDNVVAIGTPASIDFAGSLAAGHVSYQNRVFKITSNTGEVEKKMTLIQTNALVNPGNSGCPLINEYGEAVGIVTMKLNSTYYEGMCFAIPLDAAMPIINAMKNGEDYTHLLSAISSYPAKLGIYIKATTVPNTEEFGLQIESFTANTYDIASKLRAGDIITHLNGAKFNSSAELSLLLDKCTPGETVSVTFYRNGQYQTVYVVLGK